jgi:FAD/FMN-containing dehydrogenase
MFQVLLILNTTVEADSDLTCQAGARWEDINETLRSQGIPLFFPVSGYLLCRT